MYYFVYALLYLISLIPFRILYVISDGVAFLLERVIGYRRQVVLQNLRIAFPGKSESERQAISHEFYRRFTDNFMELIKLISLSKEEISRRFICDLSVLKKLHEEGRSANIILCHQFNWEWANLSCVLNNPFLQIVVYAHVSSRVSERLMKKLRTRFGTKLIDTYRFKEQYRQYVHQQKAFVLVADQSPRFLNGAFWLNFFGKRTAFTKGPETNARLADDAVVFFNIKRLRRGYYQSELELFCSNAKTTGRGEITKAAVSFFESAIRRDPPNYLWSHRRWKHSFDPEKHQRNLLL